MAGVFGVFGVFGVGDMAGEAPVAMVLEVVIPASASEKL